MSSSFQVMAGTDGEGEPAITSSFFDVTEKCTDTYGTVDSNIEPDTAYDIWLVPKDRAGNAFSVASKLQVLTVDNVAPSVTNVTVEQLCYGLSASVTLGEDGTLAYVLSTCENGLKGKVTGDDVFEGSVPGSSGRVVYNGTVAAQAGLPVVLDFQGWGSYPCMGAHTQPPVAPSPVFLPPAPPSVLCRPIHRSIFRLTIALPSAVLCAPPQQLPPPKPSISPECCCSNPLCFSIPSPLPSELKLLPPSLLCSFPRLESTSLILLPIYGASSPLMPFATLYQLQSVSAPHPSPWKSTTHALKPPPSACPSSLPPN